MMSVCFPGSPAYAFIDVMNNVWAMRRDVGFRQRASVVALAIALLFLLPHAAFAHAVLVKSSPAQGTTVTAGAAVNVTLMPICETPSRLTGTLALSLLNWN